MTTLRASRSGAVALKGTYVDDVTGTTEHDDHNATAETSKKLSEMMKSGGFVFRKWASNYATVQGHIPEKLLIFNFTMDSLETTRTFQSMSI